MFHRAAVTTMCALGLIACGPNSGPQDSASESGSGDAATGEPVTSSPTGDAEPYEGPRPQESEWKQVVDNLPFPLAGDGAVTELGIGRLEYNGNFANRGDVEVYLDQEQEVISVEMRFYDFSDDLVFHGDPDAPTEEEQKGTVGRMSLWAFVSASNPEPPAAMPPEDNCTQGAWKSGCKIYAYYDGKVAPARSGADIRVHLPRKYRGALDITTEVNSAEPSYPRVGDVTVAGLCSSGTIQIAQGSAKVKLCRNLTPAPTCTAAQIEACEQFVDPDTMQPAAWSNLCPCPAEKFGQLRIEAVKPWAGDITVDIPTTTWLNANLANQATDKPHECKPELSACVGNVCTPDAADEYTVSGQFNYPGPAAASGAGFNLTVTSAGCYPVTFFDSIDAWDPNPALSMPTTATHGHITVCDGCIE
jgi:hypothetical protein